MARAMVTQFGMSDVGSIAIDDGGFMGPNYSEERKLSQRNFFSIDPQVVFFGTLFEYNICVLI